jgi:coniferyl-aldehyde dehydrogenase
MTNKIRLTSILARQREAFLRDGAPTAAKRRADLFKLKQALLSRRKQFEAAINADFGHRSAYETMIMELMPTIQGIDYLRAHLRRWMRSRRRHVAMHLRPAGAKLFCQPLGVIGIISPWNYPMGLCLMPLATAIAAGNRAMIKPSEFTPRTTELMADMLGQIFAEDEVAVVTGGPNVGAAFSALPFDHLVFTGSTNVGRIVMRAASDNLVPVTLELGGKSQRSSSADFQPHVQPTPLFTASWQMRDRPASHLIMPWCRRARSRGSSQPTGRPSGTLIPAARRMKLIPRLSTNIIMSGSLV